MTPQLNTVLIGAVFVALLGGVAALYNRVRQLEITMASMDTKVGPLWAQVQARVAQELHHDDVRYAEMDGLLERLQALTITPEDRGRLKVLLLERVEDPDVPEKEHKSAQLMILAMEKVVMEGGTDVPQGPIIDKPA